MTANEWGLDPHLDPRSYDAAVQWRAVREAEQVVYHAEHGPGPMERFTSNLFAQLRQTRDEETE